MKGLTDKQKRVLELIRSTIREVGQPPTVREIGQRIGVASSCTVQRHLDALERKGFIRRSRYKYRSIELTDTPFPQFTRAINVPILGAIAAGVPISAQQHVEDHFPLPMEMADEDVFMLRVKGDSMKNVGIMNGDLVAVRSQKEARNGEIVAALVGEDEATVKRFYRDGSMVRLVAENEEFPPIVSRDVQIIGKVIMALRTFS
jgi:repressor LexA